MIRGRARLLTDNISGDHIISGHNLGAGRSSEELAKCLFQSCRPDLAATLQPGDIIVAGENFGCGSSREQILQVMLAAGIRCVVAKSFSRNFYRGGINVGILPIEQTIEIAELDILEIDLNAGLIRLETGKSYPFSPFPQQLQGFIQEGGLLNYYKAHGTL